LATNLVILAGLLVTAGLPPFPWTGFLVPVGLGILFHQLVASGKPARLAWVFGLAHQATLLYWLFFLDPAKSIPSRALVPLQAILAILYVSVFYLALGWVFGRVGRLVGRDRRLFLLPGLWVGMEALRSVGEMGFPWCLSGSCVVGTPLRVLAATSGEIGLGAGVALLGAVLAAWRERSSGSKAAAQPLLILLTATVVWWSWLGLGTRISPETPPAETVPEVSTAADGPRRAPLMVAAIQADVALADKWVSTKLDSSRIPYSQLTSAAVQEGAEFVVWAETALPAYVRYDKALLEWVRDLVQTWGVHLFTGFPDAQRGPDGRTLRYNSSGLFAPDGTLVDRYAKHHLLPIGEAMPFSSWLPFLARVDVGQAEWTAGAAPHPLRVATSQGAFFFSGMICFESAFAELARQAVRQGSQCLVVITNDGWFGQTAGPRQHAALARLRAVECGVPVIRCANNGISFICDERGNLLALLELGRRGMVLAEITPGGGQTCFVRWGAWPLAAWLVPGCLLVLIWGGSRARLRPGKHHGSS
jgi:apolipoprotein N-acyltransferase